LEGTMTVGFVSALGRSLPVGSETMAQASYTIPDIIQTDAPINPGNSGGVLVDDEGQVIGVTAAIESTSGANAGIGFAVPSAIVQQVVPALIEDGKYEHTWLGISGTSLNAELAQAMNLETNQHGVLVSEVTSGGPADKAGLHGSDREVTLDGQPVQVGGDVIVAINDQTVGEFDDLVSYLARSTSVGDTIRLTILRDGQEQKVEVTLDARPTEQGQQAQAQPQGQPQGQPQQPMTGSAWLGIQGLTVSPEIAQAMNLDQDQGGVLVAEVVQGGPADEAGLRNGDESLQINGETVQVGGDIIIAVDGQQVAQMEDLQAFLRGAEVGQKVELGLLRNGDEIGLTVTLGERPASMQ
jgi:serine protease Do